MTFKARLSLIEELRAICEIAVRDVVPSILEPMLKFNDTSTRHVLRLEAVVKYPESRRAEHVLTVATKGPKLVIYALNELPLNEPLDRTAIQDFVRRLASGRFERIVDHYKVSRCIAASRYDWRLQVHPTNQRSKEETITISLDIPAREFVRLATIYPDAFGIPRPVTEALTLWERLGNDFVTGVK